MAPRAHEPVFCLTITPNPDEGLMETFNRLRTRLSECEGTILHLQVFGSTSASPAAMEALRRTMGAIEWPVTWVEGSACEEQPIAGLQVFATTGRQVNRVILDGEVVGSVFAEGGARHCLLGGLGSSLISSSRSDQTLQTLEKMKKALALARFSMADIARTWFFLDDLLSWYGDFNEVRTQFYSKVKFRSGSTPASTGVAGRNPAGSALALAVWAVAPSDSSTRIEEVASPLQCPAPTYGSSFSRAMEIASPVGRRLFISGTASIALEGQTLWQGDVRRQIALTMEVVRAILRSRGLTLRELNRATAYFKNRRDVQAFREWCAGQEADFLPVIATECGICRDDLLFELEADAWAPADATSQGSRQAT